MWLIEGLEDDRFALITKTHHSLIDGIAGVDLATVLFDLSPDPPQIPHSGAPWQPHPEPGTAQLLRRRARRRGARRASRSSRARSTRWRTPSARWHAPREAAEGVGEIVWAGLNPAPETPLNVPIGPHRRFVGVARQLDDFKTVKNAFGGTVNDVVLAVVAGALRDVPDLPRAAHRGRRDARARAGLGAHRGRARRRRQPHRRDARAAAGLHRRPASAGCASSRDAMDGLKESKQALGAEVIAGAQNFAPPTILAQASRLNFSTRLFNLIVTNVPGPQFPLYVLGREMLRRSRSRSCRKTTRSRSRSCPTTAR